jgi:hypothetical protein
MKTKLPQRIFDHARNNSIKHGTTHLKTRIGIDFYQPRLEVIIYHEIEAKYLKVVAQSLGIDEAESRFDGIRSYLLHLRIYVCLNAPAF